MEVSRPITKCPLSQYDFRHSPVYTFLQVWTLSGAAVVTYPPMCVPFDKWDIARL